MASILNQISARSDDKLETGVGVVVSDSGVESSRDRAAAEGLRSRESQAGVVFKESGNESSC